MEIFSKAERSPKSVVLKTDTQVIGDQFTVVTLQFVSGFTIDEVDREGSNKIIAAGSHKGNVMPFPSHQPPSKHQSD